MKKFTTLLLIVFFCLVIAACGGANTPNNVPGSNTAPPPTPETDQLTATQAVENQTEWTDLELSITVLHEDSALPAGILYEIDYLPESVNGDRVMIQANLPLREFSLVTFISDMDEYDLWFITEDIYGSVAELFPEDAFIISGYIGFGTLPRSGVTFTDQYGEYRYFAIQHDQSLGLEPSPFMPDFLDSVVNGSLRINATTGGGGTWDLGYFKVDVNNFDPETWFIENRHRWVEHEVVIWELHNIRSEY